MYRVGLPFWKTVARRGVRVSFRVNVIKDEKAGVYVAESPDLEGLIVEAPSMEELRTETLQVADVLLTLALHTPAKSLPRFRMHGGAHCAA